MTPIPAPAPVLAGVIACLLAASGLLPVRRAIPYLTGVTLAAATACASVAALGVADPRVTAVLTAAAAVALLGLIADVGALPLVTRLIVESVAAGGVVLCGVQVTLTGDWLDGPVSVMWIVAMTNAYGLLDRLGGALASVAAVTGAFLAGTALVLGAPSLAVLAAALAGACLGALPYGRRRGGGTSRGTGRVGAGGRVKAGGGVEAGGRVGAGGRVRLGPSGSLFAGFVLTCTAADLTAGRGTGVVAAGLLLPALAAVLGAGMYASRRVRRAGPVRRAAPVLCYVAAVTGTAGLAVALGWVPAGTTAAVTAATAAAFLSHTCLRHVVLHPRLRHAVLPRFQHELFHARPGHDGDTRRGEMRTSFGAPPSGDEPRGRVPRPRSAGSPPPPVVRRG
ncbi:hypothetical protein ACQPZZ_27175 [Microbispora sp. CA-135349]|uniref:hypothetical protein n=1 Tax=Microbispora sp. CA-135349 TaxID=3239953 RepID=UPI003D92943C